MKVFNVNQGVWEAVHVDDGVWRLISGLWHDFLDCIRIVIDLYIVKLSEISVLINKRAPLRNCSACSSVL